MPSPRPKAKTFQATLEHSGNSLNWIIIRVPFDVGKAWGKRGNIKVKGDINGFEFRTSLFPTGKGTHFMIVNKKMQAGGKTPPGARARFRLQPDTEKRVITEPGELQAVLRESKALRKFHDSFNESARRDIARWIQEGKQAETRMRRAEQMAVRMMETMEAERELPPMIRLALARNHKAQAGWERMTPSHRRSHLMGIFYYRDPESRARRLAKAMAEMVAYADKRANA
ncbi:MAG: YdeI/OmpD-associated family protein [Acidobacteriia bacterium]|nr:YdeI/OmpD-associated family protein [Terriglobia bacterium]